MPAKLTVDEFVKRSREKHGDRFDYSRVEWSGIWGKVTIGLPDGRWVQQKAWPHMQGRVPKILRGEKTSQDWAREGERERRGAAISAAKQLKSVKVLKASKPKALRGLPFFLENAAKAHGDRYDYSDSVYAGPQAALLIKCAEHGLFSQRPVIHVKGAGCPLCARADPSGERCYFTVRARLVHGDKYDYSKAVYKAAREPLTIICPAHGAFQQAPDSHLNQAAGCPTCAYLSCKDPAHNLEMASFLEGLGFVVARELKRFDVVMPEVGIAIEMHGNFWHSSGSPGFKGLSWLKERHRAKRLAAEEAGFRCISFYQDEWLTRRPLVESYLKAQLGLAPRVFARKLRLAKLESAAARAFYSSNHFLGAPGCAHHFALLNGAGGVVACMSGGPSTEVRGSTTAVWSLSRFCTDGSVVVGGASRLFKQLKQAALGAGAEKMISYVDLDKYQGDVYSSLGFELEAELEPDYWTLWPGSVRRHKTATKRAALAKLPGFDPALSEFENTQRMKLWRIYHSGRLKLSQKLL